MTPSRSRSSDLTGAQIPKDPTIARWELARIGDADGSIDQIRGVAPELEFLRGGVGNRGLSGRVVGSTGCGSFLGSYETDDSTMTANGIDYRLGECTEELARQAENVMDTLRDVTRFDVLPAGLALGDDAGNTRLALVPKIDLGERIWTPIEILGADGQPIAIDPSRFTTSVVQFIGRSVEGRSYCRNFEGSVISSGLALSTSPIKPDESQRCSDKIGKKQESDLDVENAFIGALEATSSHALRGDELELLDRNGEAVMRLVPQADLVGPTWVLSSYDPFPRRRGKQTVSGEAPTATFSGLGIIKGETGAFDANGADDYTAFFTTPGAAQIKVERPRVTGTACRGGGKKRQKQCVQEAAFLELLGRATGYIVRDSDLRLLEGPDTILTFVPLASDSGELE